MCTLHLKGPWTLTDMGEGVKTGGRSRGDGDTSDNVSGTVGDIEERVVLRVVKDRPGELRGWGT